MTDDEFNARLDAMAENLMTRIDPIIRRAVDDVIGERTVITKVTRGDTTETTIETNRRPVFNGADFGAHLAEHGIAAPKVAADV